VSRPTATGAPAATDDGWGPPTRGRGRRRSRGVLRILLIVLAIVVLGGLALAMYATAQIDRIPVEGLAGRGTPMHVLLVGNDARDDLTEEQRRELSVGSADGLRTDTILLLTIQGGDTAMLSFPRDLWVERCDGSLGRINVAEAIGGPDCLVETVRRVSGIDVQHYVSVGFEGFVDLVDAVGGVELCLDDPIADRDAGIDLPAGCQTLDGQDALGYVRVRKIDDDFGRMERQQRFVKALASEVVSPATLLNPITMTRLANETGDTLTVDRNMGMVSLARMAWGGRSLADGSAATYTVPADPRTTSGGADVLEIRTGEAEVLFSRFRDGSILDEVADADDAPELTRAEVQVTVLNGAGVAGLAGQTADALEASGYTIVEVGNAAGTDATVVRHPPGQDAAARLVAGDLPGSPAVEESSEVSVVTVLLGSDAGGA
jgi:LCP family protein required for cell wall assembly